MSLKGINFTSTKGLIQGELSSTTIRLEQFKDLPSYNISTNEYGFSQYATSSIVESTSNNDTIHQAQIKFTNYPYFNPSSTVTNVLEDTTAFFDFLNSSKSIAWYTLERDIKLISSCKLNDNKYLKIFYQYADSDSYSYYNSIIATISTNADSVPRYLVADRRVNQRCGDDNDIIIYSYDVDSIKDEWKSTFNICINPIFVDVAETKFYDGEVYLAFIPFYIFGESSIGNAIVPHRSSSHSDPTNLNAQYVYDVESFEKIYDIKIYEEEPEDPDEPIDPTYPIYPPSDPIDPPPKPPVNPITSGLVNAYLMNSDRLLLLHNVLFPTFTEDDFDENPLVNLANEFKWIWNTLKSSQSNQYIISCHGLPITPTTGSSENIKLGNFSYEVSAPRITEGYYDYDFGTISLDEIYHGFEDYAFTDIQLYLPFGVGYVPLPNEFIQGGSLKIIYRFNVADGTFIAYIISTSSKSNLANTVVKQYSGSAVSNIPMTGSNYSQLISNVVTTGVSSVATSLATSNPLPAIASGMDIANNLSPLPSGNNDMSSSPSLMTVRKPYLIISRSISNYPDHYASVQGKPSLISAKLSALSGYTECIINADDLKFEACESDKSEIINLLNNGIII